VRNNGATMMSLQLVVWATLAGILGLLVGSFLNVVVYRVPAGLSVVRPSSHCPNCGSTIRNRHNVPVLGWLALRGKCADCAQSISARYPIVEALTAALFVVLTIRLTNLHIVAALPAYLYFAAAGLALAAIDLDHRRLPDLIVLPSYAVVAVLLVIASAHSHDWWALGRAAIAAGSLFSFYFAIAFAYPGGMGFGDVKLAGLLGGLLGYLSWSALVVGAFAGFALGAVAGVIVIAIGRGGRKTAVPFGPFMIAGAMLAVFVANPLAHAYLHVLGRA
jgi:leader peptidase (prepilin peptidase) / N-methyltransferase